jgi:hypothetical protein
MLTARDNNDFNINKQYIACFFSKFVCDIFTFYSDNYQSRKLAVNSIKSINSFSFIGKFKINIFDEHLSMTIDGLESQGADPLPPFLYT